MICRLYLLLCWLWLPWPFTPSPGRPPLPNILFGMIGIFIVIGVIILVTYGLNKAFSKKKKDDKDEK